MSKEEREAFIDGVIDAGETNYKEKFLEVLGIDRSRVYRHFNDYMEVGLDEYLTFCVGGRDCWLAEAQQAELKAHLSETFYQSAKKIRKYVVATFGIRYSESEMIKLLHQLDFVYKQAVQVPHHPEPKVQESFVEELNEKMENLTEEEGHQILLLGYLPKISNGNSRFFRHYRRLSRRPSFANELEIPDHPIENILSHSKRMLVNLDIEGFIDISKAKIVYSTK